MREEHEKNKKGRRSCVKEEEETCGITKVQFSKFENHYKKLGFNESQIVEANGFSGGLWTVE